MNTIKRLLNHNPPIDIVDATRRLLVHFNNIDAETFHKESGWPQEKFENVKREITRQLAEYEKEQQ